MNLLSRLMGKKTSEVREIVAGIDAAAAPRGLRRKFEKIRNKKQGGFTLLELLVVVAILAAIAGTAVIMLHDTDRKAFAAAHVAHMDTLAKGILTFKQLNGNYPNVWDSLMSSATGVLTGAAPTMLLFPAVYDGTANDMTNLGALTAVDVATLDAVGINAVRVLDESITHDVNGAATACANTAAGVRAIIDAKTNNVTAQTIFMQAAANGCGAATNATLAALDPVLVWDPAQNARVNAPATDRILVFGIGNDLTLFQSTNYGALSTNPIYRHVAPNEYNRYFALFNVTPNPASPTNGQAVLQAIIDGAGDTKDEELGEFDNVRPT
jgi:prepilin-type N-terminal cleavage/methylation domain-containing protein